MYYFLIIYCFLALIVSINLSIQKTIQLNSVSYSFIIKEKEYSEY